MVRRGHLDRFRIQMLVGYVLVHAITPSQLQIVGLYPKSMFINRGNHEAKEMNRTYGFEGEAKHKHGEQTYKVFSTCIVPSNVLFSSLLSPAFRPCLYN